MKIDSPTTEKLRWGVVGGGMLGLTLAHRLAQYGQEVTLFDAAPHIGGLASGWHVGDVAWDRHYHVTLLSDKHTRGILRELDLEDEMRWVETKTGFFTDGELYSMSNSWEFLRFPPLGLINKLRLGATIFAASKRKNWRPLEQLLVADWLRKWSGRKTFEKIWKPLLLAKLGDAYRQTSAAFIWATIARMYKARQSGLKKEMFGYLPGGYARVLDRFADLLIDEGVNLQLGARVRQIHSRDDGRLEIVVADDANAKVDLFDRVIITTPSALIPRLCPELDQQQRTLHEQIEYLGVICASVVTRRPLASYYVTNITDGWTPFTAVVEMTTLVDPAEFGGQHLTYLPRYASGDDEAWQWSDEEVEERFVAALLKMYPDFKRDDVVAFRVSRAKHVMALPTVGYSERLPPMETSISNLFAVNSAHIVKGTLNVNEVVELADAAFDEVLKPNISRSLNTHNPSTSLDCYDQAAGELVARP